MAAVSTVLGPIEGAALATTLVHEHVCSTSAGLLRAWPELFGGRTAFTRHAAAALRAARLETGLQTIVDPSTHDLGRDVRLLREVSRRSGVNIVCATGHWLDVSRTVAARGVEELAGLFSREIEQGIEGTGIRAGVIKVANGEGLLGETGVKLLRAVARAHRQTGAPIITHSDAPGRGGALQADLLQAEGVDLRRVCVGHSNDSSDVDYLIGLLARGCWLGLDRFPGVPWLGPSWEERTRIVKLLIDAGYAGRILLSHDEPLGFSLRPAEMIREYRTRINPDGILFISRHVVPRLLELDVPRSAIDHILVDNPRRFLEGVVEDGV